MTTRAFMRCTSGHYYQGECCPFDGWSSRASKELALAQKRLYKAGVRASIAELRKIGVSEATLARTIVIEFGSDESAFEALSPDQVVAHGETISHDNLDVNLT